MLPLSRYSSRTRRPVSALVPLAVALLCLGICVALPAIVLPHAGPVYSVSALWARVQDDPDRWIGRTVRVYAVAERCAAPIIDSITSCRDPRPALFDAASQPWPALLLLPDGAAPTLREWLHRLPLVSSLVPALPTPRWGVVTAYTLQVRLEPCLFSGSSPCQGYAALLL
jgi:hypothetical protein